jgi:DNA adenine methylase
VAVAIRPRQYVPHMMSPSRGASSPASCSAEPFVKWAGGKRLLLPQLLPILTLGEGERYVEPFLGGGAVFFALAPDRALLSDALPALIESFVAVRDTVDDVISQLRRLERSEAAYYRIRSAKPRTRAGRAAQFIYLNKTCFNGLYRVNLNGQFNVPYGRHGPNLLVCDAEQLHRASAALRPASIEAQDFEAAIDSTGTGDLVYCDPPYTIAHAANGFVEYNARVFRWEDQRRLAAAVARAARRGARVAVSNADHPSIRDLYCRGYGFTPRVIRRWSTMAASAHRRFETHELLLLGGAV